jgi:hypothetical protein
MQSTAQFGQVPHALLGKRKYPSTPFLRLDYLYSHSTNFQHDVLNLSGFYLLQSSIDPNFAAPSALPWSASALALVVSLPFLPTKPYIGRSGFNIKSLLLRTIACRVEHLQLRRYFRYPILSGFGVQLRSPKSMTPIWNRLCGS